MDPTTPATKQLRRDNQHKTDTKQQDFIERCPIHSRARARQRARAVLYHNIVIPYRDFLEIFERERKSDQRN